MSEPELKLYESHPTGLTDEELLALCEVERTKATGPGGQHRNKVETAIRITYRPAQVVATATENRHQGKNMTTAIFRLRLNLAVEVRSERSVPQSDLFTERIQNRKIVISPAHADFPILLAEVLDLLSANRFEYQRLAARLETSGSQLLKFLRLHPPAFEYFNQQREALELPRLRFK